MSLVERLRAAADELIEVRCAEDAALMREAADVIGRLQRLEPSQPSKDAALEATIVLQ